MGFIFRLESDYDHALVSTNNPLDVDNVVVRLFKAGATSIPDPADFDLTTPDYCGGSDCVALVDFQNDVGTADVTVVDSATTANLLSGSTSGVPSHAHVFVSLALPSFDPTLATPGGSTLDDLGCDTAFCSLVLNLRFHSDPVAGRRVLHDLSLVLSGEEVVELQRRGLEEEEGMERVTVEVVAQTSGAAGRAAQTTVMLVAGFIVSLGLQGLF